MPSHIQPKNSQSDYFQQYLTDAETLECIPPAEIQMLRQRFESNVFNLVVMGEFKRGKSSVINALIGEDVLPVGVVPLTAIATILEYGKAPTVQILFQDGTEKQADVKALWDFATEKGNPDNEKGVSEVHVSWPSPWLKSGVRLIDTPGIGSVHQQNSDVAYGLLPRADAVLLVLSVDQPIGQVEYDFLKQVRDYAGRIFFLLNKSDLLTATDLAESQAFTSQVITEAMGFPATLFPFSARLALEGRKKDSAGQLSKSGFLVFTEALKLFLAEDKGNALVASLAKGLLRLLSQTRFSAELTLSSLTVPVDELRQKVKAFESKRDEMAQGGRDFSILLKAEVKHLADQDVTADVEDFMARLSEEIEAQIRNHYDSVRHLSSHELDESLRQYAMEAVRTGWDHFRRDEDEKLEAAFHQICARFNEKINATVDELYRFSSDLFSIPFDAVDADSAWDIQSGFYYKFWEVPGSIRLMTTSFLHALPKFLGDQLILRDARKYAQELTDTQAGRVRYDFAQRLDKSMRDFNKGMCERLTVALAHIESAVKKGLELAAAGSAEADDEAKRLNERLKALATLVNRVKVLAEPAQLN
ncbi:bacterial dynamin-like protein [bacterium BMS3Bbin11]|nr:bacterial dynamin-like protein [bacterium BMS3Abin11]GBE45003.1 bacterial dynamin-like protein [bacterium BMS3Bbin11]GMT40272.1 MAG: hypothetical protein IEMM0001_1007 [bacterium]HDH16692.1 hypothetical protein [Gammaproteobacteria bacterium]HDZ78382.1 hypothetical protein [Gammaproteobacteria bacterium]